MTDTQTSSPAEVESYGAPSVSVQSIQFAPVSEPGKIRGPGNENSSRWSTQDDINLCDALITQKKRGRCREKALFILEAWNDVAEELKGSELVSGGAQKNVAQCKARWQRLKTEYRIIKHLRQQPGFQWDESTQMVTALVATWDAYIAEHRDAQPWRKKAFPTYGRVAYLVEDEHGNDPGEEKFKRRWNAGRQSAQERGESEVTVLSNGHPTSSTSVFSVVGANKPDVPVMPFASQVVPGVPMGTPLNGGASAIHQYRLPTPETNGKRAQSPIADKPTNSKRSKSTASGTTTVASPPQGQHLAFYPAPPVPHAQPYTPGPISYVVPPAPPSVPSAASRLAMAIQVVEESEDLPDSDFVRAVQLFQRRAEAADAYLAIQSKHARSLYLRAELDELAQS